MILRKSISLPVLLFVLGALLVGSSSASYAQRHRRDIGRGAREVGVVGVAPRGMARIVVRGQEFFYAEGKYYRHGPKGYVAVAAPVGARLAVLHPGFASFRVGRLPFFVSFGTYYRYDPAVRMYVVVQPPPNAPPPQAPAPPLTYDKITFPNGETLTGTYLGGSPDTVEMQVGNVVQLIGVDQISSIQFAPPQPH